MSFSDLLLQSGAKHYRLGPIAGRVDVLDGGSTLHIKHSTPFGWGEDKRNTSNWFGVSVYHPDWFTELPGGVAVHMSLNGMSCPYNKDYDALFQAMAVKYLKIEKDGDIVWQSWTGEVPTEQQINELGLWY